MKDFVKNIGIITSAGFVLSSVYPITSPAIGGESKGLWKISQEVVTGNTSSETPLIKLAPGHGINISFIPTGEIVEKIWLDNPGFASIDVDGCLSGFGKECQKEGATVLHLRRINTIQLPQLPKTNSSLLTVVTKGNSKRQLYSFRIEITDTTPKYHTVEIIPKSDIALGFNNFLTPPETETIPSFSRNTNPRNTNPRNTNLRNTNPRVSNDLEFPGTSSSVNNLNLIRRGIEVVQQRNLISPDSRLWGRIRNFYISLKAGESIENAASQSGISLRLVNRLINLGKSSKFDEFR